MSFERWIMLASIAGNAVVVVAAISFAASGHWSTWSRIKEAAENAESTKLVILSSSEEESRIKKLQELALELDTWTSESGITVTRLDTIESQVQANNIEVQNACGEICADELFSKLNELQSAMAERVAYGDQVSFELFADRNYFLYANQDFNEPGGQAPLQVREFEGTKNDRDHTSFKLRNTVELLNSQE